MAVRAVVIAGSPRKRGNSDIMAEHLVGGLREGGAEVEVIHARDVNVAHCLACYHCSRTGQCIQKDDMQRLYQLFLDSHRICLVTPIFFCQVPSITQAIIERTQTLWVRRYHRHEEVPPLEHPRQGLVAAVGATMGKRIFDGVRCAARYWLDSVGIQSPHLLTYNGIDERGAVRDHPEVLEEMHQAGLRLARPEGWPAET